MEAAKRLVRRAADQLEAVNLPGIIVVDVSTIIETHSFILPREGVNARVEIGRRQAEAAPCLGTIFESIHDPRSLST